MKTRVQRKKSERPNLPIGKETHKQLKVIAALEGIGVQEAHDKYAAPAVAKVFAEKTASK